MLLLLPTDTATAAAAITAAFNNSLVFGCNNGVLIGTCFVFFLLCVCCVCANAILFVGLFCDDDDEDDTMTGQ